MTNETRKYLKSPIQQSLKLLSYFVLASGIIASLFDGNFSLFIPRLLIGSVYLGIVFCVNTIFIYYYYFYKSKKSNGVQKKIFLSGLPFTLLFIFLSHLSLEVLKGKGVPIPTNYEERLLSTQEMLLRLFSAGLGIHYLVFLVQNFSLTQYEKNRMEQEVLKLKSINTETTNRLLQQQIQPHFLFNALNVLKSLIKKHPEDAEKYLLRLSDFLRVSVAGSKTGIATVAEELKICNDYMQMQLIRFGNALHYEVIFDNSKNILNRKLPFFSLQPLLENAIKHNTLTNEEPLKITISNTDEFIVVSNNLQPKNSHESSTRNGLTNLQERYKLISGDMIIIEQSKTEFRVSLKLI